MNDCAPKTDTLRSKKYLEFVRNNNYECLRCGDERSPLVTHHVRKGTDGGVGKKPSDCFVMALCHDCHSYTHNNGEQVVSEGFYLFDLLSYASTNQDKFTHDDIKFLARVIFERCG